MKKIFVLLSLCIIALGVLSSCDEPKKTIDKELLQGTWKIVSVDFEKKTDLPIDIDKPDDLANDNFIIEVTKDRIKPITDENPPIIRYTIDGEKINLISEEDNNKVDDDTEFVEKIKDIQELDIIVKELTKTSLVISISPKDVPLFIITVKFERVK